MEPTNHLERKMIFQTSMIMFHVNLQGCTGRRITLTYATNVTTTAHLHTDPEPSEHHGEGQITSCTSIEALRCLCETVFWFQKYGISPFFFISNVYPYFEYNKKGKVYRCFGVNQPIRSSKHSLHNTKLTTTTTTTTTVPPPGYPTTSNLFATLGTFLEERR